MSLALALNVVKLVFTVFLEISLIPQAPFSLTVVSSIHKQHPFDSLLHGSSRCHNCRGKGNFSDTTAIAISRVGSEYQDWNPEPDICNNQDWSHDQVCIPQNRGSVFRLFAVSIWA